MLYSLVKYLFAESERIFIFLSLPQKKRKGLEQSGIGGRLQEKPSRTFLTVLFARLVRLNLNALRIQLKTYLVTASTFIAYGELPYTVIRGGKALVNNITDIPISLCSTIRANILFSTSYFSNFLSLLLVLLYHNFKRLSRENLITFFLLVEDFILPPAFPNTLLCLLLADLLRHLSSIRSGLSRYHQSKSSDRYPNIF